ncbi:outer membrane protein [Helicobacter ailurogastricus]|uniref:outer membrane protein n=1 Tax=Helicobacter ailurogastricus TaxID=1578720 RepID=UPI001F4056FA|nr:outer membrane protein [Helicobacter ailurogastricus]
MKILRITTDLCATIVTVIVHGIIKKVWAMVGDGRSWVSRQISILAGVLMLFPLYFLKAEGSGGFVEGGFQYSRMVGVNNYSQPKLRFIHNGSVFDQYNFSQPGKALGNLYGGDFQFGYKQFFGQNKRFGLRYYGFFSGQTGNVVFSIEAATPYKNCPYACGASKREGPATNLFYGAGIDVLYNFYDNSNHTFGIFGGVMAGGSSWLIGKVYMQGTHICSPNSTNNNGQCVTYNESYLQEQAYTRKLGNKANFIPTFVQCIVNVGFRLNFTEHQGIEAGVRIPIFTDPYYTERDTLMQGKDKYTINFKRTIVAFANYVISF